MNIVERLTGLRRAMQQLGLDGYVIPSSDPHMSEYVPARFQAREYMSGFTGSAGTLVVTEEEGRLYVDGRYILQAQSQAAGSGLDVHLIGLGQPEPWQFFLDTLHEGARVGCCAETLSMTERRDWQQALDQKGMTLVPGSDLVDALWPGRPAWPHGEIWEHPLAFAGRSAAQKLAQTRAAMAQKRADCLLLSSLDDIAWLFNLRGDDVSYVPVFCAWALLTPGESTLFVHPGRLNPGAAAMLAENGVTVRDYDAVYAALSALPEDSRVALNPDRINCRLAQALPEKCSRLEATDITTHLKACKDDAEQAGMRQANLQDGLAMCAFMQWLPKAMAEGPVTELDVGDKLRELRLAQPNCIGESFSTIAAYGPHGAMMHYNPANGDNTALQPHGLMVLDSGAQYLSGTTDITRTVVLGDLTDQERHDYTLALKSHIALARARFPEGITGTQLDTLARAPIWHEGLDYRCGTGHGVGLCLSVHEGPVGFRVNYNPLPVRAGMVLTVEPGIYREGLHGVRHENMVLVVPYEDTEYGHYLQLEPLTLCPIDVRGLDVSLLDAHEIDYLNAYHRKVMDALSPHMDEAGRAWLAAATAPIG
jgi:Xaa-Pro aminopeptidase